jgi:diguanylate cyclase (GGDEF)-like protein
MTVSMAAIGSWLCPTERDRERLLDMSARVRRARQVGSAATGLALLGAVPALGWLPMVFAVLSTVNLLTVERRLRRSAHPETVYATSLLFTQLMVGGGVAVSGGPHSPLLMWIAIPTVTAAIRFPYRVVGGFIGSAIVIATAVAVAVDPAGTVADPTLLLVTIALVLGVATPAMALQGAELQHREDAVIDQLTGLLNRKALVSRFTELEQQARQSEASVCVIAADLDHFKQVNDTHGHAVGDEVLRDVTGEMRKRLRTFELMYRLGGEEFLVVLPGVDLPEGVAVAERLRAAVEACDPGGIRQTISMGVAAACGAEVTFDGLLGAADRALYEAKKAGRNVVRADGHDDLAAMLEALGVVVA